AHQAHQVPFPRDLATRNTGALRHMLGSSRFGFAGACFVRHIYFTLTRQDQSVILPGIPYSHSTTILRHPARCGPVLSTERGLEIPLVLLIDDGTALLGFGLRLGLCLGDLGLTLALVRP